MTRRRLTRAEARERTRQEILVAARQLFGQKGYRRASIEQIAETAGYSTGAVYSNWSGKEALFLELLNSEAQANDSGRATPDLTPTTWAIATLEFFLDTVDSPVTRAALAEGYERARNDVARQIAADRPDPDWATWREIASLAMAAGSGLIIQNAVDPDALDSDLLDRLMSLLTEATRGP